jgi:uncharacterized RDD family membrane protein YckC/RNA polymerase subunit RPABC4/transcription elongation factor Spt4
MSGSVYTCLDCGATVSENDATCPNCGANLDVIVCSECKAIVSEDDVVCPSCGAALSEEEESEPSGIIYTCLDCGATVSEDDATCPNCGADLDALVCSECKAIVSEDDVVCPSCGADLSEEEEEQQELPEPPLATVAVPPTLEGKKFGVRAGAYVIDTIIINLVALAGGVAGVVLLSILFAIAGRPLIPAATQRSFTLQGSLISLALSILYFAVFEWLYGASPGKLILRLRVVREDGGRPSLWAALVRGGFRFVDGLFFGIPAASAMGSSPLRQRIGDRFAHTVVVGHRDPMIRMQRSWLWFALASVLSISVLSTSMTILALDNMVIAPPRTVMAAAALNLRLDDLGRDFTLEGEEGKDAFESSRLTDANVRVFATDEMVLEARVLTFPFMPQDTIEDLVALVKQDLANGDTNQEFSFEPIRKVPVGERAGVVRFVKSSTGEEGYLLFSIQRNVFTRLLSFGAPGAMTQDELVRLARIVDARIR